MSFEAKKEYVKGQKQTRDHSCHWPACEVQVPPALWGCRKHWMQVPAPLRLRLWSAYRPEQEIDGKPSQAYLDAARAIQAWIRKLLGFQVEENLDA